VLAGLVGYHTFGPQQMLPDAPIEAEFLRVEEGWEITFDVADLAVLDIVAIGDDGPLIVHRNVREDRGRWATGGGNYRVYVPEMTVALIATESGIGDLQAVIKGSTSQALPMEFIKSTVQSEHPTVAWVVSPAITTDETADVPSGTQ